MSEVDSSEQEFWDRRADAWERRADLLSAFSDVYGSRARDALHVEPGARVLDVGCGPGTTAIELAARVAPGGEVLGVDISPAMVAAATRRAAASGVDNVRFVAANAQTADLGDDLDAAYSRFGVMFFADPVAAFANIGASLRAGGRLACSAWAPLIENPWMLVPTLAAGPVLKSELTIPGPDEPGPFSLSDPGRVIAVLTEAGFVDIAVDRVDGSRVITSATADTDVRALLEVGALGDAYSAADDSTRQGAVEAVLGAIEPYRDTDGWRLPGAALVVVAHRPR
ncbi:MAG: class I SAM-dependent methyltransferase [Acidimicrobiales bacterium]